MLEHPLRDIVTWYQYLHFTTIFVVVALFGFVFCIMCIFVGIFSCPSYSPSQKNRIKKLRQQYESMAYYKPVTSFPV
uniref:Uncharacterized protein n=1 Tax=Panagrolaimus sp. PS1159 TaxID=55785 RepID=A0AC35GQ11_9BILA